MAGILSLGIAGGPIAQAVSPAPVKMAGTPEMGTSGTAIFGGGFLRDLGEYNSDFSGGPFSSYRLYEQMRRGDAQVAATLSAIKLPIRCGEWAIEAPDEATPEEEACAEFVEDCLLHEIDFDAVLQNALLMLDFGAACHEDCWRVAPDASGIGVRKLAPRLPSTFYTWDVDENEDLKTLVQMGYHGGNYVRLELPADSIALFTFQQEGSNFAGRSLLRAMYQHWYIKANLYKVDAIACERNGCGIPTVTLAQGANAQDRAMIQRFLDGLAAHEHLWMMLPADYKMELVGTSGQTRDPEKSIAHHNTMISMAGLAQFMMMGQSSGGSGNRSLGETMSDFFYLSLQALANQIGRVMSLTTVARLAALNYSGVRAPRLVPQKLLAVKFESVVTALTGLSTSGMVTPTPELEAWLRGMMGAPEADKATIITERKARASMRLPAPQQNNPTQRSADAGTDASHAGGDGPADKSVPVLEAEDLAAGAGVKTRRAAVGVEKCLALSEVVGKLDQGTAAIADALRDARSRVQAEIIHKLVASPVRNMHRVSIALDEKLVGAVEEILRGVAEFGQAQVGEERGRQLAGGKAPDALRVRAAKRKTDDRGQLGLFADGVVSEFQNGLQARAATLANEYSRTGGRTKGELINVIGEDLDEQSDKWLDAVGAKGANEAFADGRSEGFAEYADEIKEYIYSAILDLNTCEACAAADGLSGATEDEIPAVPNDQCDGGDRCRCVVVAVFADEVESKK